MAWSVVECCLPSMAQTMLAFSADKDYLHKLGSVNIVKDLQVIR